MKLLITLQYSVKYSTGNFIRYEVKLYHTDYGISYHARIRVESPYAEQRYDTLTVLRSGFSRSFYLSCMT